MKGNNPLENVAQKIEKSIPGAIKIDEKEVFDHLDTLVRQSVIQQQDQMADKTDLTASETVSTSN